MSSKRYPDEFKIEAVKQVVDRGHSVADVAGFVGFSIEHNTPAALGAGLSGTGDALTAIAGSANTTLKHCDLRENLIALQQDHNILLGNLAAIQDGQEEILRLLLVPQGRRRSDFCHDEICSEQDFPSK